MICRVSKKKTRGKNDMDPPMPDLSVARPVRRSGHIADIMSSPDASLPPPCIHNLPVQQIAALERLADFASMRNTICATSPPADLHFESFVDAIVTDCEAFVPNTPILNIRNNNKVQSNNTQHLNQVISSKRKTKVCF
jgi:hypothetical protein